MNAVRDIRKDAPARRALALSGRPRCVPEAIEVEFAGYQIRWAMIAAPNIWDFLDRWDFQDPNGRFALNFDHSASVDELAELPSKLFGTELDFSEAVFAAIGDEAFDQERSPIEG